MYTWTFRIGAQAKPSGRGMAPRHCVHKFRQSLAVGHHHFRASTPPTEDERSDSTGIAEPVPSNDGCASKARWIDRKSTRLNSSHANISYAVFCLKKKK